MRVVRVFHAGVVSEWRERDRQLRARGVDVTHIDAQRWNEGGAEVELDPGTDDFVIGARTIGRHPYRFVIDPRPIWRALRLAPVDVIDVHEEPASLVALELLVLRRLCARRAPIVFYGAQNLEKRFPPPFRWIERLALRAAAGAYCCNREAGEIFRRKGLTGVVATIPLGIDLDRFTPRAFDDPPGSPFRVGYVGRLEHRKGVGTLIEALALLDDGVQLELFGDGPDAAELVARAEAAGVAGRVVRHGYITHDELPEAYRQIDVLAVPSRTTPGWVEQFGRVVTEAMACAIPVIVADSGSLPDVAGDAGIVLPEDQPSAWAAAIDELRSSPAQWRKLAEASLDHARQFAWTSVAAAHHQLYRQVCR